jgi:DNA-binding NtrC family response regulator
MPTPRDILIIDDEIAIIEFMAEALQDEGYTVRSASDCEQGLREIAIAPPALVLLDLHMPGMTVVEFLEHVPAVGSCAVPIIIMTADQRAPTLVSTHSELTYLFKPFDLDELVSCVARFIPPPRTRTS